MGWLPLVMQTVPVGHAPRGGPARLFHALNNLVCVCACVQYVCVHVCVYVFSTITLQLPNNCPAITLQLPCNYPAVALHYVGLGRTL